MYMGTEIARIVNGLYTLRRIGPREATSGGLSETP